MSDRALARVLRRETHSPRTVAMIVAVALAVAVLAYTVAESIAFLFGGRPLLTTPGAAIEWLVKLPDAEPRWAVTAGAAVVAMVGVVFLVFALSPGRLPKHRLAAEGRAALVDNGVIASSLAQRLSHDTGVRRDHVVVGVGHRSIDITLDPGPGAPLDEADVRASAQAEIDAYRLTRPVSLRVRVVQLRESDPRA